eukprot:41474-Pleurochrysis_carterae.AAC.1
MMGELWSLTHPWRCNTLASIIVTTWGRSRALGSRERRRQSAAGTTKLSSGAELEATAVAC